MRTIGASTRKVYAMNVIQKSVYVTAATALAGMGLAGCSTDADGTSNKTVNGALIGTAIGATGGYFSSGNDDDRRKNALIGAGVGVLAGGLVGNYMDKQEAQLRQDLKGTGVQVSRQGDNILLNMPNQITFGFDEDRVQSQFYPTLNNIGNVLNQYGSTMIDIYGHTDSVGSDAYNLRLSERRAGAVADYLIGQGVNGQRLVVRGRGESQPIASNSNETGRAQNRRVEIVIAPVRQ